MRARTSRAAGEEVKQIDRPAKGRRRSPSRGARFAAEVRAAYELSPAEEQLLDEAARCLDELDRPGLAVREAVALRGELRRLLAALALEPGESSAEVRAKARRAARARWARVVPLAEEAERG